MRRHHRFILLAILMAGLALAGAAQVSMPLNEILEGSVLETSGTPVVSARVELRAGESLLATALTDAEGHFVVRTDATRSGDWTLRAERLGYGARQVPVGPEVTGIVIELAPAPISVVGFQVEGERDFCAAREDAGARDLWFRAATLAMPGLDTLGIASYTRFRVDTVGFAGGVPPGLDGAEEGQRASAPLLRLNWDRRVIREGYAFAVRRTDAERSYDSWSYPPLEADFAPHFLSESFGRLHSFHSDVSDGAGWILRFCGRSTNRPYLDGILEIGPDTVLRKVEWHFRTPEPEEAAGGWARFPPPDRDGSRQILLPTESVTWRSLPGGERIQRAQWYEGWHLVAGDSVPFLPDRTAAVVPPAGP